MALCPQDPCVQSGTALCPSPSSSPVLPHGSSKSISLKSGERLCGRWGLQGAGCAGMGFAVCQWSLPSPGTVRR